MSKALIARQLFAPPGENAGQTRHLLAQAAGAHARLLHSALPTGSTLGELRASVATYLRGPASGREKRFVLDDPDFVGALHTLAPASRQLTDWDTAVAPGCQLAPLEDQVTLGCGRLGNTVAALHLRRSRDWCGRIELATDQYGRIHFPFCDWAVVLTDERHGRRDLLVNQTLVLDLQQSQVRWWLPEQSAEPLLAMPRRLFNAMFVDNWATVSLEGVRGACAGPQVRFERASRLGKTRIRFEPIGRDAPGAHAELTGGIVASLLSAIEHNAPHIHRQLCQCIRTVHGFELAEIKAGQIASFSVPTSPGVIGFNVSYTANDEPCLSPYCFLWLGHELGHTLHYLIDDVAYMHGWPLLENPGDTTPIVPRYGRGLKVRTLIQVPYVHLFEWWLLMLFLERDFAGLPWTIDDDIVAVGEDLRAEIRDSFDWIDAHARLTPMGEAVMVRVRELTEEAESQWRKLSFAALRRSKKPTLHRQAQ